MIRQPSSFASLYAWWSDAVRGRQPERHEGLPEAGYYRMKLVRGGPWVAVEIVCERDLDDDTGELAAPERLVAVFDGRRCDAERVWTYVQPISRPDYLALLERARTDDRMAATLVPVDLASTPTRPPRRPA